LSDPATTRPMGWVEVTGPDGQKRLELRPLPPGKAKGKQARRAPDPIKANPEASAQRLRLLIERIERIEAEEDELRADKKDVYGEVKAVGFDAAQVRKIVALRKIDASTRAEAAAILETYMTALGLA
jgi:uncharacterized protein (UPF0335 family)